MGMVKHKKYVHKTCRIPLILNNDIYEPEVNSVWKRLLDYHLW